MGESRGALYSNGTASAQIKAVAGRVYGILINSHTSGTLKLWDSLTAANAVVMNTFTLAAGSQVLEFPEPIVCNTGIFLTIGGTVDYTVLYN